MNVSAEGAKAQAIEAVPKRSSARTSIFLRP
jgi:hypothetical protein